MTKSEFREMTKYLAGPNSLARRRAVSDRETADEVEAFDPKLAELIRAGADAWQRVHDYVKTRVGVAS